MTDVYVRKSGSDTLGDGSSANPWLTISKALSVVASGDRVLIGDGDYAEDTGGTGYLNINFGPTSQTTLEGENGAASMVTIHGASHASTETLLRHGNMRFRYLTFVQRASTTSAAFTLRSTSSIDGAVFESCAFRLTPDGVTSSYACLSSPAAGVTHQNISFTACDFSVPGYAGGAHEGLGLINAGGTIAGITLTGCSAQGRTGLNANGATGVTVTGGVFTSTTGGYGILCGKDAEAGGLTTTAAVSNAEARALGSSGHAVLLGNGALNCSVSGLLVRQCFDYGLVLKESAGHEIQNCNISGFSTAGIYCKAAASPNIHNNTLRAAAGACFKVGAGGTGNTCSAVDFQDNRLFATGTAGALLWSDASGDAGGGTCNGNIYSARGSAKLGNVRAATGIATLAALRAAWSGYDTPGNDARSRLAPDPSIPPFLLK